jgi:hypothetical protein
MGGDYTHGSRLGTLQKAIFGRIHLHLDLRFRYVGTA